MTRSGYSDEWDGDGLPPEFYRSAVDNALLGKRGQAALRELAAAMDAMPVKELAEADIADKDGCLCAMGVLGVARGWTPEKLAYDPGDLSKQVGLAPAMVREIIHVNDDDFGHRWPKRETKAHRWERVRAWVAGGIARGERVAVMRENRKRREAER